MIKYRHYVSILFMVILSQRTLSIYNNSKHNKDKLITALVGLNHIQGRIQKPDGGQNWDIGGGGGQYGWWVGGGTNTARSAP